MKTKPGYLAFQIFALEVFRKDPELFGASMEKATFHLTALKNEAGAEAVADEEEAIDLIYGITGLLTMFRKDDASDLPDIDPLLSQVAYGGAKSGGSH